jgi:hypothetical protein
VELATIAAKSSGFFTMAKDTQVLDGVWTMGILPQEVASTIFETKNHPAILVTRRKATTTPPNTVEEQIDAILFGNRPNRFEY